MEMEPTECCPDPATGTAPVMDLDHCVCSGKSLARLLRPALLALLAEAPAHGYDLAQRIAERNLFATEPADHSGVYKTLKEMEKEGAGLFHLGTERRRTRQAALRIVRRGGYLPEALGLDARNLPRSHR